MTLCVAVVGGGRSAEHDVSVSSAEGVAGALTSAGMDVVSLTIGRDGRWWHDGRPLGGTVADSLAAAVTLLGDADVMVPMVHGAPGEDGALAALAELAGVPCAGSPLRAGALAMDKWVTKLVARELGVGVAPARLVTRARAADVGWPVWSDRPGSVVVKPVSSGSSFGVSVADDAASLAAAVTLALTYDDRVLVEQRMVGREIDVALFRGADGELVTSPPLEILVAGGVFGTPEKYDGGARFRCPAPLAAHETDAVAQAASTMYTALGCAGVVRVDFFLTQDDGLVLNEVNTTPGSTAESQVPLMYGVAGLDFPALVTQIVRAAGVTDRNALRDQNAVGIP